MTTRISLRALTRSDAEAHLAGEDEQTVRWLSGGASTLESTTRWIDQLVRNAQTGRGTQGFGVCLDGRLAGYVDCNPDVRDGLEPGDVNISYAVHPWARGRGIAVEAVRLICDFLREHQIATRAAIRVDPDNQASVRVAEKSGFSYLYDFVSGTDKRPDGTPATLSVYVRGL
jgi:RimJ/RimL family protein N-acetyltransferase